MPSRDDVRQNVKQKKETLPNPPVKGGRQDRESSNDTLENLKTQKTYKLTNKNYK